MKHSTTKNRSVSSRALSFLLTLLLILPLMPAAAFTATALHSKEALVPAAAPEEKPSEAEKEAALLPATDGPTVWDEIDALKEEYLSAEAETVRDELLSSEDFYAGLLSEVEALITSREDYVPGSVLYENGVLYWESKDGRAHAYDPSYCAERQKNRDTGRVEINAEDLSIPEAGQKSSKALRSAGAVKSGGVARDAAFFSPFYGRQENWNLSGLWKVQKIAQYTGGNYEFYPGTEATIDRLAQALQTCCVVVINTHGSTENGNVILTSEEGITQADYRRDTSCAYGHYYHVVDLGDWEWRVDGVAIVNHMTAPACNGLFVAGCCHGMNTQALEAPLRGYGVAAVFGWSRNVSHRIDTMALEEFLDAISKGYTIAGASQYMREKLADRTGLFLIGRSVVYWDPDWLNDVQLPAVTENEARSHNKAFVIITSDDDPYPSGAYGTQCKQVVTSTWTIPARESAGTEDIEIVAPVGYEFKKYFGDAWSGKKEGVATILSPEKLPPSVTWGCTKYEKGSDSRMYYSFIVGKFTEPGYWETDVELTASSGAREIRKVRLMAYQTEPPFDLTEQSETYELGDKVIIPLDLQSAEIYRFERLEGSLPDGAFLYDYEHGLSIYGYANETGVFNSKWRVTYWNGQTEDVSLTMTVRGEPLYYNQSVTARTNEAISLALETGDKSGVLKMEVIDGAFPSGVSAGYSQSEAPYIRGACGTAGDYTVKLRIVTGDLNTVVHTVSFRIYAAAEELDYLRLDLTGGCAHLDAEQYERVWTSLLYASMSSQISVNKMSFDLDKDGSADIRLDRNMKTVTLLGGNSLSGDYFPLEMNSQTRQRLVDAGKTEWYLNLNFWLVEHYLISIDGIGITSRNRNDVLGNGVFSFDGLNTITVHGDYTARTLNPLIENLYYPELTVRVESDSDLNALANKDCILTAGKLTITGPGRLNLRGGRGIVCQGDHDVNTDLILTDASLSILASEYPICALESTEKTLVINRSDVYLNSTVGNVVKDFNSIELFNVVVQGPVNYTIEDGRLYNANTGSLASYVKIDACEKFWDLKIKNVIVTDRNRNDVLGDGVFSFDGVDTLYVNGSCKTLWSGIVCGMPRLNVVFAPNVELKGNEEGVLNLSGCEATITGGPAKLTNNWLSGAGILLGYKDGVPSKLFIADMTLEIESACWGIYGPDSEGEEHEVILTNSDVNLNAAVSCFLVNGMVTLSDCDREGFTTNRGGIYQFMSTDGSGPATRARLIAQNMPDDLRFAVGTEDHTFSFTYGEDPEPLILNFTSVGRSPAAEISSLAGVDGVTPPGWIIKKTGPMTFSVVPDPEILILNGAQDDELVLTVGSIPGGAGFEAPLITLRTQITYPAAKTLEVEDVTISLWDDVNQTWVAQSGETCFVRPGKKVRLSYIEYLTRPADEWIIFDGSRGFEAHRPDYEAYGDDEAFYFVMPAGDLTVKAGDVDTIDEVALVNVSYPNSGNLAGSFRSAGAAAGSPYTFVRFDWIDDETGEALADGDSFVYGKSYTGNVYLKPARGYYFDRNDPPEDVTINGSDAPVHDHACGVEYSGLYRLETGRRVTDPGTITSVSFTVPIPGDGAYAPRYPRFIDAEGDPSVYATTRWLTYDGSSYSDFTGTFVEGDTLYLSLYFHCTDPNRHFLTDGSNWLATNVYINGVRRDVRVYGDDIYLEWPVTVGPAAGYFGLSEFSLDYLIVGEPDNAYTHIDAYLSTGDPSYEPELVWRSSDPSVAVVQADEGYIATVTAVGYGEATITAMTEDGLYSASLSVFNRRPAVRGVEVDRFSATVFYPTNNGFTLHAKVYPENAGNKRVYWRSSDDSVAGVSSNGDVIPRNRGICWITAVTEDGGYESTCEIVVREPESFDLWIDQVEVNEENMGDILYSHLFTFDGDRTLTINGSYTARTTAAMIVSSVPDLIINVANDAALTARNGVMRLSGDTTITGSGALSVSSTTVSPIYVMDSASLTISGTTLNADGPGGLMGDAEGESLNIYYATVNVNAIVSGWAIFDFDGGVTLRDVLFRAPDNGLFINGTAYDENGSDISTVNIGPSVAVTGVTLSESSISLRTGGSASLTAQIAPFDATDQTFDWSVNDSSIASVDEYGVVTATGSGTAYVTVCSGDGRYVASCRVRVVSGTSLSGTVTSFGDGSAPVTLRLIETGETQPSYETEVTGNDAEYVIAGVRSGNYTLRVMKAEHATLELDVTVSGETLTQNALISFYGDTDGDGNINTLDLTKLRTNLANPGESILAGADINDDGDIDTLDLTSLRGYLANPSTFLGPEV